MYLTKSLFAILASLLFGLLGAGPAVAQQDGTAATAAANVRFASVWRLRGEVVAAAPGGQTRTLREGDAIFVGESVRSDSNGEAVLKTEDAGIVAVRPGASFAVEKFSAQGRTTDHMTLRVLGGALRVMTGWIGRVNRSQHLIVTPTASIGIRGTDHEPYVMTTELATKLMQAEGTYNKVNRGGTTLAAYGRSVDVTPGKVGFVRTGNQQRNRALMTLLLPVLLDKIPEFYLPGQFEGELDQLSETTEDEAARQFEERARTLPVEAAPVATLPGAQPRLLALPDAARGPPAAPVVRESALSVACGAGMVARTWLGQLDAAIARREAGTVLGLFAPEAPIRATVRDKDGNTSTLDISRQDFVDSSITAMQGLTDFRQRRLSVEGQVEQGATCDRVNVRSLVLEQGTQNGRAYRVESIEEFELERRAGKWQAVKATTTQR